MDELEPLEKTGPLKQFQMAFMTIPVNPCPRRVRPFVFVAQIVAEAGSIDMLANGVVKHVNSDEKAWISRICEYIYQGHPVKNGELYILVAK